MGLMLHVLAVDPGDKWTGWATYSAMRPGRSRMVSTAGQLLAVEALEFLDRKLANVEGGAVRSVLVLEEFRLYADKATEQTGSEMLTAQQIGALRWIARQRGAQVVQQGAGIQKPTERQLAARGIELRSEGSHAKSAQLHLVHYLLKEGYWK